MYDSVLFPTDGSEGSEQAREHALELAADQDAVLHVLNVVEVVAPGVSLHETIADRLTEQGTELVDEIADAGRERGIAVTTAVLEGDPADRIVAYASSEGIDVIVMPTRGRSGLEKVVVGSVTDKVVRSGDVPVLLVRYGT